MDESDEDSDEESDEEADDEEDETDSCPSSASCAGFPPGPRDDDDDDDSMYGVPFPPTASGGQRNRKGSNMEDFEENLDSNSGSGEDPGNDQCYPVSRTLTVGPNMWLADSGASTHMGPSDAGMFDWKPLMIQLLLAMAKC